MIWDISRLARKNTTSQVAIEKLEENGVEVATVQVPLPQYPQSRKVVRQTLGMVAELESDLKGDDVARGQRHSTERAFWTGPTVPYGYEAQYIFEGPFRRTRLALHPTRAPAVRAMFDLALQDMTDAQVTRHMNKNGPFKDDGTPYTRGFIAGILKNPAMYGTLVRGRQSKKNWKVTEVPDAFVTCPQKLYNFLC